MTTSHYRIAVGGIPVEIVRKEIKNLHVGVYPPAGRVRIAAPVQLEDEAVRLAVVSRLGWIRRKQKAFAEQERQSCREMVSGESHYVQGRRCVLRVIEEAGSPCVHLAGRAVLELRVRPGTDRQDRDAILQRWYRQQLRISAAPLAEKWALRAGVEVPEVRIRKLKTLWGSCNASARCIWLNLELAKKPIACLEYIVVHEIVHLLERNHNKCFRERMDALMPSWQRHREELNRAPLAHANWKY